MVAPYLKQTWVLSGILINVFGLGLMMSYPTSLLPALQAPDSPIKLDLETISWLASVNFLSSIVGFIVSSFTMSWWGRRFALILSLLPSIPGWLFIYFGHNIPMLMIGRILTGASSGGTVTLGAMAVGEYSSPKLRGIFLSLKTAFVCLGATIGHILAYYYDWRTNALFALTPQIVALLITATTPESPSWLLSKNKFEECKKTFILLRGDNLESRAELEEMLRAQKERMAEIEIKFNVWVNIREFLKKFTRSDFLKPTAVVFLTSLVLETSGRHVFPGFSVQFIEGVVGITGNSFYYNLCIDLIITTSSVLSTFLVKIMKRRTLLFVTGFAALLILKSVCVYLYLVEKHIISGNKSWIPTSAFIVFFVLVNLGCTSIPIAVLGEIYPLIHKGAASIVSGFIISFISSIIIKATPYMLLEIKVYGTFAVLGAGLGTALILLIFILPETKDKTLQEIEDHFMKDNNKKAKNREIEYLENGKKLLS